MNITPLTKINDFFLKREDLNFTGSAKDRALIKQVENLKKNNFNSAVISSTGNAAISAIHFCQQQGIGLTIFVSPKIDRKKLSLISSHPFITSPRPISDAIKFSKKNNAYLLRQSTDSTAQKGYQAIAREILDQNPDTSSIFIPVGSGTTLLGIASTLPPNIPIFAVQSATNPSITSKFSTDFTSENQLITDALSVKYLPNKSLIISAIERSQGSGITIQNQQIIQSQKILSHNQINCSPEGGLVLAALYKARLQKLNVGPQPVLLITGTKR